MSGADKVFAGNIPAIYEQYMAPMLFEPYAPEMAERAAYWNPQRVIEIAAGTGVLTRELARQLGTKTEIVATDLNQPMLDAAASLQEEIGNVSFAKADALSLPFPDESFDLAACQFGVMFFPDKPKAYREAYRVLKPGGHYIFAVWDRISANEFVSVVNDELARRFPDDPPKFMERTPHGYFDAPAIVDAMKEAGFTTASSETVVKVARARSAFDAAKGYCQGNPLRGEIEGREPDGLEAVTSAVASALADRFGSGMIEGRICAHIISAQKA